ncbi:MAG: DUF3010 family protein [Proteobacteria bacterium]|nr:DUF3010 family protein [Pseudomonadota bacterium]
MSICGIEMSGSEARLALLDGTKAAFSHIDVEPRKIKLSDDENPGEVKAFRDSMLAFFRENQVTHVVIKKRGKKGEYSGGPVGFKLEGIIQLHEECPVTLTAPQTISAAQKNHNPAKPTSLKKYQHNAFETAFSALP